MVVWFRCWVVSVFWPTWWLGFAPGLGLDFVGGCGCFTGDYCVWFCGGDSVQGGLALFCLRFWAVWVGLSG